MVIAHLKQRIQISNSHRLNDNQKMMREQNKKMHTNRQLNERGKETQRERATIINTIDSAT